MLIEFLLSVRVNKVVVVVVVVVVVTWIPSVPRCLFRPFILIYAYLVPFRFCMLLNWSLDNGVMMTPKRRALNLSCFFYMPLLQQIPTDQMFKMSIVVLNYMYTCT